MRKSLFLCSLLLLTSCAALKNLLSGAFTKPTLTFKRADLANVSLSGATVNLIYELHNPNSIGISLASVDYLFKVEGHQVAAGKPPNGFKVAANGTSQVVFPAQVKFADLGSVLQVFLKKSAANYEASGHVGVDTPIGVLSFPLEKKGTFPVPKVPAVVFGSPKVTQLSLSGATFSIPLAVTNHNPFPLPVGEVAGNLKIGGVSVGQITSGGLGSLTSNQTRTVSLPVSVNFASAGMGLFNVLKGGSHPVQFSGGLQSGGAEVPVSTSQVLKILN